MNAYQKLHDLSKQIKILQGVSKVLGWDQETYMPPAAGPFRGEQLKAMAGLIHKQKNSRDYREALAALVDLKTGKIKSKGLSAARQAALRMWHHDYKRDTALPQSFVEEFTQLSSQSMIVWSKAKTCSAFHHFAPFLDKIIALCRKKADLLGYKEHPYDALLDLYEPGTSTKEVDSLFKQLKQNLLLLLKKIQQSKQVDDSFLYGKFSIGKQQAFGKKILEGIGYDMTRGRLDLSSHPFSIASHPTDSRITTRIDPAFVMSNISAILHEAGHSFYEMGLPVDEYGSPLGEAISLGMHESQSRWWETRLGHSKAFWKKYLPLLKKQFKGKLENVSLEKFYKGINKVAPTFIRVEADEVTYSLHVILRFELEKNLIEGKLKVRDIPEAWNDKMKELLNIEPKSHSDGCLQDIHWSMGAFGYFPTYTLGNLYASHLFEAFEKEHSNWEAMVAAGDFGPTLHWLRTNIHRHGRRYFSKELLKKVGKKPFSADAFARYLSAKYGDIYGFQ